MKGLNIFIIVALFIQICKGQANNSNSINLCDQDRIFSEMKLKHLKQKKYSALVTLESYGKISDDKLVAKIFNHKIAKKYTSAIGFTQENCNQEFYYTYDYHNYPDYHKGFNFEEGQKAKVYLTFYLINDNENLIIINRILLLK